VSVAADRLAGKHKAQRSNHTRNILINFEVAETFNLMNCPELPAKHRPAASSKQQKQCKVT